MQKPYYSLTYHITESPTSPRILHCHDEYEILLYEEGDSCFIVEDKMYTLNPGDIIISRKHEMHRILHGKPTLYRRFILMVDPEFFQLHNCTEYEKRFLKDPTNTDNKISAKQVRSSGLYDAFEKYKKYSKNFTEDPNSPILTAILIEILYLIHKISRFSTSDQTHWPIRSIIQYLNNNYTENITLDMLSQKFFISKYYLCRIFHQTTGLTIHDYIRLKRLTLVRELNAEGKNLGEAAITAGFTDYSSFYRAYKKEYGVSPRNDIT